MKSEKTADVLNSLVEINNDRVEGYVTASGATEEHDLKSMFSELANTSKQNIRELSGEIRTLGGTPTESTKVMGKFFRAWMNMKAALTGRDRKAILDSCEFGEDQAIETYEEVLKDDREHLSAAHQTMIAAQYALIKADLTKVKLMGKALA